jgi:hypothetical protein
MVAILTRKPGSKVYRTVGAVAQRYAKHVKTIDRWIAEGVLVCGKRVPFPPSDLTTNHVRHWLDSSLDEFDAAVAAAMRENAA